jgi:ubiquinone biosynthesis protein UbiJ
MPATPAWLAAIEAVLNRGVQGTSQAAALARRLEATALRLDIEGVAAIRVSVCGGRLALTAAHAQADPLCCGGADAAIAGSPFALLRLVSAAGGSERSAAHPPAARIRGDAEIANLYRQLIAAARPDWEEELSRLVGDLAARRFSRLAERTVAWGRRTRATAGQNIAEFLQEESRDLVTKPELEEFLAGVDGLRERADRIAARITRLERLHEQP